MVQRDWRLTWGKAEDLIQAGFVAQADLDVRGWIKFVMMLGSYYRHCGLRTLSEDMERRSSTRRQRWMMMMMMLMMIPFNSNVATVGSSKCPLQNDCLEIRYCLLYSRHSVHIETYESTEWSQLSGSSKHKRRLRLLTAKLLTEAPYFKRPTTTALYPLSRVIDEMCDYLQYYYCNLLHPQALIRCLPQTQRARLI